MNAGAPLQTLLGRRDECKLLDSLLDGAQAGRSGSLIVRGEPGIGKTALLEYAVGRARNTALLRARGVEAEAELAFSGLSELLRPLLSRIEEIPAAQAAALKASLGLARAAPGDPFSAYVATLSLLALAAEDRPLLVAVDDGHWLDVSSLQALVFAARRLDAEGVALVIAVREAPATILNASGLPELTVERLDRQSAAALLARSDASLSPEVASQLLATANGNPLALLEMPAHLTDAQAGGREPLPDPLPAGASIERAFARRLATLDPRAQLALLVAAASDERAPDELARALVGLGLPWELFREAEAAGLASVDQGLRFRHPLVRSAVYHSASAPDRRAAHLALARATAETTARRAWHLALSAEGPDEQVAAALEAVALDARGRSGHGAAAAAFERAAALTSAAEGRHRRLVEAASDWQLAGQLAHSTALLEAVLPEVDDPLLRAHLQTLRARAEFFAGTPASAHVLLVDEAERIAALDPDRAAAMLAEACYPCMAIARPRMALAAGERALALAEPGQGMSFLLATLAYGELLFLCGDGASSEAFLERALVALDEADPLGAAHLIQAPSLWLTYVGRFDDARRLLDRTIAVARERSAPGPLPLAIGARGHLSQRTGHWMHARSAFDEAIQLARDTGQANMLAYILAFAAPLSAAQGREEECRARVSEARALGRTIADGMLAFTGFASGHLALSFGRYRTTIEELEPVAALVDQQGIDDPSAVMWGADLVEALARDGRRDDAEQALSLFTRRAERAHSWCALAAAARCRGLLAEGDAFEQEFADALDLHDRVPMPFERARTELCYGERLRRAGRRADARHPLRSARATFERLGAAPWVERAASELRATGETVRRRDATLPERLTPHELQVALVVAAGATNKEAAAQLFLSPKTIDFHLRHVYRKLGIGSRAELARLVAREEGAFSGTGSPELAASP